MNMGKLKDTAKGKILKCQFRANGKKDTFPHSTHGNLTSYSTVKYNHEQSVYAYEDLPSALEYNHIRRMDKLKDTAKGKKTQMSS